MKAKRVVVGVDLGGTNVRAGLIDELGNPLAMDQRRIRAEDGPETGLERIVQLIEQTRHEAGVAAIGGIGIGATGPVDSIKGVIRNPYTLPGWEEVPITAHLQQHFSVPVALENDADTAALGEYWLGAGKGVKRLYAVTVGTGIGAAFILDGEIYRGLGGIHPEGGHQVIDPHGPSCYCRARGCWESLASGSAIASKAQQSVESHPSSVLSDQAQHDLARLDARTVCEAARGGDILAGRIIQEASTYLALGLVNIVHLFTPEVIVLSGGVMDSLDLFMPAIQEAMQRHNIMVPAEAVRILPAKLGSQAGLFGAAYRMLQML